MTNLKEARTQIEGLVSKGALLCQKETNRKKIEERKPILGIEYDFVGIDGRVPGYSDLDVRIWIFGEEKPITLQSPVKSQAVALGKWQRGPSRQDAACEFHFGVGYQQLAKLLREIGPVK